MKNTRFDKSKLPGLHVTEGPERAPHRSFFCAMAISEEEGCQPWVGSTRKGAVIHPGARAETHVCQGR